MLKIAYEGEPGSNSEYASLTYFGKNIRQMPFRFLPDVFNAVEKEADYGMIPIENSTEGAVTRAYDLLSAHKVKIVGEHIIRINHCLLANEGVKLKDIKTVYSHPQALAQCREYLDKMRVDALPFYDTAGSAKMVSEEKPKNTAAIASARAAKIYGLNILGKDIETNKHNYTRFVIVTKKNVEVKSSNKTSIVFDVRQKPGSLFSALEAFAVNKINLLFIQSRPMPGKLWEYRFFVDCEGDVKSRALKDTLYRLRKEADRVKILGSYQKAKVKV